MAWHGMALRSLLGIMIKPCFRKFYFSYKLLFLIYFDRLILKINFKELKKIILNILFKKIF